MENEVSGIAKLGIVLIALAVLIGLGFGIFQISKSVANDGVGDVQAELDGVSASVFTTYDQKVITGTMAASSISDFEGESTAVLIATQAWINAVADNNLFAAGSFANDDANEALKATYDLLPGISQSYTPTQFELPVVYAYGTQDMAVAYDDTDPSASTATDLTAANVADVVVGTDKFDGAHLMETSKGAAIPGCFINYNAILGNASYDKTSSGDIKVPEGCTAQLYTNSGTTACMAGIYFDTNCFRVTSGFATSGSGKVMFNNITGNLSKTGRVEYIPSGAKFDSYLVKDASGTNMGIALTQVNG